MAVTDVYTYYLAVHDDGGGSGSCTFLENGVSGDYALFAIAVPDRSVELGVTNDFSNLLQSRNAIADPAAAVDQASQWLGYAEELSGIGDWLPPSKDTIVTFLAEKAAEGILSAGGEGMEETLVLWKWANIFRKGNLLGLVMGAWLGDLYDAVAYIQTIDHAELRTSQAYFVASVSTALSGVGDLLLDAKPIGVIYLDRPDDSPLGFAVTEALMDDWLRWDGSQWVLQGETPWPAFDYGVGVATGTVAISACCSSNIGELALNGYLAGHLSFFERFYLASTPPRPLSGFSSTPPPRPVCTPWSRP